jgi:hypothetical protein
VWPRGGFVKSGRYRCAVTDLAAAWDAVHEATPPGWQVGRGYYHDERGVWEQCAWLPSGRARGSGPEKDWIAVGATEVECVREMACCLRELDGRLAMDAQPRCVSRA